MWSNMFEFCLIITTWFAKIIVLVLSRCINTYLAAWCFEQHRMMNFCRWFYCVEFYISQFFTNMPGFGESCNLGKVIIMFLFSFPMFLYFQFHLFIPGKESHLVFLYCFSKYSHCSLLNMRWVNTAMQAISSQFQSIISTINMNLKVIT